MSAYKFALYGIGTALFRVPRILSANPPLVCSKPSSLKPLRFHRCSYSSAVEKFAVDGDTENISYADQQNLHPWPEWVSFVDRLKTKGYLTESSAASSLAGGEDGLANGGVGVTNTADTVYRNINLVKDACLSFARDRYDVFKSLSEESIQAVVKSGCPNLLRKAVNSAKRLRAHVRLDEGDICSTCTLRNSCDRAYVVLKENEATARTVDLMRILVFYALDPLVISGGEKPPGREFIESSARKLLSELIEMSESSPSPAPVKPTTKRATPKDQSPNLMKIRTDIVTKDVDMKPGDWICPKCSFNNFARNIRCLKCRTDGPKRVDTDGVEKKKGDWTCRSCGFMNFASNKTCLRCPELRPKRTNGEWHCPRCDFLNFAKNKACLKCNCKRPAEQPSAGNEDHLWTRPS